VFSHTDKNTLGRAFHITAQKRHLRGTALSALLLNLRYHGVATWLRSFFEDSEDITVRGLFMNDLVNFIANIIFCSYLLVMMLT
jgi:hypothetical protein